MGGGARTSAAIAAIFSLLFSPLTCSAQDVLLDRTDSFDVAFGMSYSFDACGDSVTGELFRKAVMDKFATCPFTVAARDTFMRRAADMVGKMNDGIRAYVARYGRMPERLDGMKMSCDEQRHSDDYIRLADQLRRYNNGEVPVDQILGEPCDVSAGGP